MARQKPPVRPEATLALVDTILDGAFFSPLHLFDWPAYCFGQGALLGLEMNEAFDVFVRGAIAAETIEPERAQGRAPLAWLWSLEAPRQVLAHVLASLKDDRPMLFHRLLYNLASVREDQVDPAQYEVMEDFLAAALDQDEGIQDAVGQEIDVVLRRALRAAGQNPRRPSAEVERLTGQVLAKAAEHGFLSDQYLRLWLIEGEGLAEAPPRLRPAVLALAWARWCGAVSGTRPDLELLQSLWPELGVDAQELAGMAPAPARSGQVIEAACPYCAQINRLRLGARVEEINRCPHLIYLGSDDELHLWQVAQHFDLGRDFVDLMASYLESRQDIPMFCNLVNDLFEMFFGQERLRTAPVTCESAPRAFYFLRAYFAGDPDEGGHTEH